MSSLGSVSTLSGPAPHSQEVNSALEYVVKFGKKWLLWRYFVIAFAHCIPTSWAMFAITFLGGLPDDYHCKVPENTTLPKVLKDGEWVTDKCRMYSNLSLNNETIPCTDGWVYYTDYENTVVMEWDLVCDKDYLSQMAQTIFVIGVMAGAGFVSPLADLFGRKTVHIACQVGLSLVGVLTIFTYNYPTFAVMRFFGGVMQQGIILSSFVQICEFFPANKRTVGILIVGFFWSLGIVTLSTFAYFVRNWRHLQLLISLPGLLSLIGIWIYPETIPWLVVNHRYKEAENMIHKATKHSKRANQEDFFVHLPLNQEDKSNHPSRMANLKKLLSSGAIGKLLGRNKKAHTGGHHEEKRENLMTILRHPKLRWCCLIMCLMWLNTCMTYYGISLSATSLLGNRYLNFGLVGLVEIPAQMFVIVTAIKIGRRIPSCFVQVLAGVCLITVAFIPSETANGTSLNALIVSITMVGMWAVSSGFTYAFLYGQEIYPTNVRNTGMGLSSVWARIGGMLAPFAAYTRAKIWWFPGTFLGTISIVVGFLVLYLPETAGRPLPQTIDDMENWTRKKVKEADMHNDTLNHLPEEDIKLQEI